MPWEIWLKRHVWWGLRSSLRLFATFLRKKSISLVTASIYRQAIALWDSTPYRKVLDRPLDIVMMATPPNFRPLHFEAAVAAGCHCFVEKPVAVDAPGARRMYAAGKVAAEKGLTVVSGIHRLYNKSFMTTAKAVQDGAIGTINGGRVHWLAGALWVRPQEPGQSNALYLANNWVNFTEMSGDIIVDQQMHNLHVANWFTGRTPRFAVGFGGRARRRSGNQYDFFSVDYDYGENCAIHGMCRQLNGSYSSAPREFFVGTEGSVTAGGRVTRFDGREAALPEISVLHDNGLIQEHVVLLQSILSDKAHNDIKEVTDANLTAIMGRISAYTGQLVRWIDLTEKTESPFYHLALAPAAEAFEQGEVELPDEDVAPIPGSA
jgi:myo-inositol 2-dehydrogenase/D-chiro-inositol 1-dehydrogenase